MAGWRLLMPPPSLVRRANVIPPRFDVPELPWLIVSVALVTAFGSALAVLSYWAYWRTGQRQLCLSALGFVLVTLGGLAKIVYQFGVVQRLVLTSTELVRLQVIEGFLLGIGLVLLVYSLRQY